MTQEEKQLLLADLCARLPYKVKCQIDYDNEEDTDLGIERYQDDRIVSVCTETEEIGLYEASEYFYPHEIKPYLRSMSSMTEEERQWSRWYQQDAESDNFILYMNRYVKWLDSKHFDWRTDGNGKTLIELGIALEAPEGMYSK